MSNSIPGSIDAKPSLPRVMTVEETCEYLGLSDKTVLKHLRSGAIPGTRLGRRWYINAARLAERLTTEGLQ